MSDHDQVRLPTYYISHGGGPWPWLKGMMPWDMSELEESLLRMPQEIGVTPKAVLMVSGHWEAREFTVMTSSNPPMVYDYGGFPEFTYHISYPAPGSPAVAARVQELLRGAGIEVRTDPGRGFDHGVFAPLVVAWPDADVPVLQLSLKHGYDPTEHLAVGRALAPLRDEGVLIVGSGLSYHNLRMLGPIGREPSRAFDAWLDDALTSAPDERVRRLEGWETAPSARVAHPSEDHLVPLMVAVGAAEDEPAIRTYHETEFAGGVTASSYRFGDTH